MGSFFGEAEVPVEFTRIRTAAESSSLTMSLRILFLQELCETSCGAADGRRKTPVDWDLFEGTIAGLLYDQDSWFAVSVNRNVLPPCQPISPSV